MRQGNADIECIEIICLYLKGYFSDRQFEDIFSTNIERFESSLAEDIYLEIVSVNFTSKEDRIRLKTRLKEYISIHYASLPERINDAYIERKLSAGRADAITGSLKHRYEKRGLLFIKKLRETILTDVFCYVILNI